MADVEKLSQYFHLFDKVYVGSLWPDRLDPHTETGRAAAITAQTAVLQKFYDKWGRGMGDKLGWYQTVEGSLNAIGSSSASAADWGKFYNDAFVALNKVKPLDMLWSPVAGKATWSTANNGTGVAPPQLEANLESLFCNLSHPVKLHFQDYLGQSVSFEFPFHYNYTQQYSCEGDTVPYLQLLQRVSKRCPNLQEVKVNMEVLSSQPAKAP